MKPITDHPFTTDLLTSAKYFWNCRTPEQLKEYYKKLGRRTDNDSQALLAIVQEEKKLCSLIRSTVVTMDGWCAEDKACVLAALVRTITPKVTVEIGVFGGRSLIPMAMALKHWNIPGKVVGIDPYSSQESANGQMGENAKWWSSLDHQAIKSKFLENVKRLGLESQVELIEKASDNVEPIACDMLHIDGNHSEQALRDAERFGPSVRHGGIVVLDDLRWEGGAVLRAIDALEEMGFVEAFRIADWNVMQRLKKD